METFWVVAFPELRNSGLVTFRFVIVFKGLSKLLHITWQTPHKEMHHAFYNMDRVVKIYTQKY